MILHKQNQVIKYQDIWCLNLVPSTDFINLLLMVALLQISNVEEPLKPLPHKIYWSSRVVILKLFN